MKSIQHFLYRLTELGKTPNIETAAQLKTNQIYVKLEIYPSGGLPASLLGWIVAPHCLPLHFHMVKGSVKQSDRNSSKMNVFHKLTSYEQQQQISFATDEYGQVGVFRIRMRSLLQKL